MNEAVAHRRASVRARVARLALGVALSAALGGALLPGAVAAASAVGAASVLPAGAAPGAGDATAGRMLAHADGKGTQGLPGGAAGPVSRFLGRVEPGYRVARMPGGFVARNTAQRLTAKFGTGGITVVSGDMSVGMRLRGYGDRSAWVRARHAAAPSAAANRVVYRHGRVTEKYSNGPLGLEQSFAVAGPRGGRRVPGAGDLTVALAVSGQVRMAASRGGVIFSRGGSSLAYGGLVVTDARGRRLPARISVAGRDLLLHVHDTGARFPVTIDPLFQQQAVFTNSAGSASDQLGWSVAVDGATMVVGAPNVGGKGAAYVFTEPGDGWSSSSTPAATLTNAGGSDGDSLGWSVAVNGGTVVAGDPNQAAAYVFTEPADGWSSSSAPTATLTTPGFGSAFGYSVAVDGGTIAVGETGYICDRGAVFVFAEPGGGWSSTSTPAAILSDTGSSAGDLLGSSLAIDGGTVVTGAPSANSSQGAAYVYSEPGGGWSSLSTPTATLTNASGSAGDQLGYSVAVSGGTVVTGAPYVDSSQGAAYVYSVPGGGWSSSPTPTATLTNSSGSAGDDLGISVAVAGGTVVAGAPGVSGDQGAVSVFSEPGGGWATSSVPSATLAAAGGSATQEVGGSVGFDGATLVTGAPDATVNGHADQGAAYAFGSVSPSPGGYGLGGFLSPHRGSRWRPGSVLRVAVTVRYANGNPIPGSLASLLSADCELTVRASGAQRLAAHCLRYDSATGDFTYRWHLRARPAGQVVLEIRLAYPSISTVWVRITIGRGGHHRGREAAAVHGPATPRDAPAWGPAGGRKLPRHRWFC